MCDQICSFDINSTYIYFFFISDAVLHSLKMSYGGAGAIGGGARPVSDKRACLPLTPLLITVMLNISSRLGPRRIEWLGL